MENNGSPIMFEDAQRLFKPFSKLAETHHQNPNGNGLGLSICKQICESLGGSINVTQDRMFTKFMFRVRVKCPPECDLIVPPSSRLNMAVPCSTKPVTKEQLVFKKFRPHGFDELCAGKKLVIVCAEDSFYNMETLRITFSNLALTDKCRFTTDGQQAIDVCLREASAALEGSEELVMIVILDQTMPRKTGV